MKRKLTALLLSLLLCCAFLGELTPALAAARQVYVVSNTLDVYRQPKSGAKKLGSMSMGEKLTCLAVSGGWAQVKNSSGAVGYCAKSGLSTANPNSLNKTVYIRANNTPIHKQPSASSGVISRLRQNAAFTAVARTRDGKWYRLKNGGRYGYVQAANLSFTKISVPKKTAPVQTRADRVASLAQNQLGKPYAYGAEGSGRFDCSGLTYYVYKAAAGVKLKRTSGEQGADGRFTKISSVSSLKKGDLVCFNTGGGSGVDHVGVYIGGGRFIHSSSKAGKVISGNLSSGYYRESFLWGRRIV